MILVVADLHLGKTGRSDAASLTDLMACIRHHLPDLEHVIFLGDTFDAFVEYPNYIPSFVRSWAELVRKLQNEELKVTYVAGNHDRWHRGYIQNLIRNKVKREAFILRYGPHRVSLEHGDAAERVSAVVRLARRFSDSPFIFRICTLLLPFGGLQKLAALVSNKYAGGAPDDKTVSALEDHAANVLQSDDCNVVVMGHCHRASFSRSENGIYINTGDWVESRTFVLLESGDFPRLSLSKWSGSGAEILAEEVFSAS